MPGKALPDLFRMGIQQQSCATLNFMGYSALSFEAIPSTIFSVRYSKYNFSGQAIFIWSLVVEQYSRSECSISHHFSRERNSTATCVSMLVLLPLFLIRMFRSTGAIVAFRYTDPGPAEKTDRFSLEVDQFGEDLARSTTPRATRPPATGPWATPPRPSRSRVTPRPRGTAGAPPWTDEIFGN